MFSSLVPDAPNQTAAAALLSPYYLVVPLVGILLGGLQCRRAIMVSCAEIGQTVLVTAEGEGDQFPWQGAEVDDAIFDDGDTLLPEHAKHFETRTRPAPLSPSQIDALSTVMETRLETWKRPPAEKPAIPPPLKYSGGNAHTFDGSTLEKHAVILLLGAEVRLASTHTSQSQLLGKVATG